MTPADWSALGKYVRWCADALGLRDWEINLKRDPPTERDVNANVHCIYGRRLANIRFARDWRKEEPAEQRHDVLHELIHCHLDAMEGVFREGLRHNPSISQSDYDVLKAAHHTAIEYATDALAAAIAPRFPLIQWPTPAAKKARLRSRPRT